MRSFSLCSSSNNPMLRVFTSHSYQLRLGPWPREYTRLGPALCSYRCMDKQQRRRWRVKDTVLSPWQDLPGLYTAAEMSAMQRQGCFEEAAPADAVEYRVRDDEPRSSHLSRT